MYTADQQKHILMHMLREAKPGTDTLSQPDSKAVNDFFDELLQKLSNESERIKPDNLLAMQLASLSRKEREELEAKQREDREELDAKERIKAVNLFLAILEENMSHNAAALNAVTKLKELGLYSLVYGNSKFYMNKGMENIFQTIKKTAFAGVNIASFSILAFLICGLAYSLVGAPYWLMALSSGLFVGASVYIAGVTYGILNDIFAVKLNFPYYLVGHQPGQSSILKTHDKMAYAIGWGVLATAAPVGVTAIIFTIAATILAFQTPLATVIMPMLILSMPIFALSNEMFVRSMHRLTKPKLQLNSGEIWDQFRAEFSNEQITRFKFMCPTPKSQDAFMLNGIRNLLGYLILPTVAILSMVYLFKFSKAGMLLSFSSWAPLTTVIFPVVIASVAAVFLFTCKNYLDKKAQTMSYNTDRYDMAVDTVPSWDLCFKDEREAKYAAKALETYKQNGSIDSAPKQPAPSSTSSRAMFAYSTASIRTIPDCENDPADCALIPGQPSIRARIEV